MKKRLRLIISLFSASFLGMVALSLYSLQQFDSLTGYSNRLDRTNQLINQLYKVRDNIKEIDIKERGFMLSHDSTYFYMFINTADELQTTITNLQRLTGGDTLQTKNLIMLKSALALRIAFFKDNLNYLDSTSSPETISVYYKLGMDKREECVARVNEMLQKENSRLYANFKAKKHYEQIATNTIVYLLVAFLIATMVLFIILIKELRTRIRFQDELQNKLRDLKRSHSELEQIAFAASHDLKEPLRKIKVFGDRLLHLQRENEDEETNLIVERINYATDRMQDLINDMVNLTRLVHEEGPKEAVDLNFVLMNVIDELDEKVKACDAQIYREVMPILTGYPRQFHILFQSLLDNALKFRRSDVPLLINIRADIADGDELLHVNKEVRKRQFHRITISDNGIGFDNNFISKMFRIFQRLHNRDSEYDGKGIGLAICQRIMVNHNGHIIAHGHPNEGASFKLFFPVED